MADKVADQEREQAIQLMEALPSLIRRAYRDANALVGMLSPLVVDLKDPGEDAAGQFVAVTLPLARAICVLAEGLRDSLAVPAQYLRHIASLVEEVEDAWKEPDGVDD